jgi:hypothetical protein
MIKRAILFGVFSIATVACGSDPNKRVDNAQEEQLKAQRKTEQQAAEDRKNYTVDDAETQRKSTLAAGTNGGDADEKRLKADAKMTETRQVALADAKARLQKAEAKTEELRALINKAGGKATTQAHDALRAAENQRTAAKMSIDQLANSTDAAFKEARDYAEGQLDTLEGYVKQAAKEVDAFE